MMQPQGFTDGTSKVCRLRRSLYGLKQSPRCWNTALNDHLKMIGFKQTTSDPCVYTKDKQLLAVYVDDLLLVTDTVEEMAEMKRLLSTRFKMKDLGALHHLLGLKITQTRDGIFMGQENYISNMLKKFNMESCNPVDTPADVNVSLVCNDGYSNDADKRLYQSLVGSLLYAAIATRPDISQAVSKVCKYTSNPSEAHMTAAKRILRYLKGTADLGLFYRKKTENKELVGYCDSDYAGDRDSRKSTTGHCFMLGGAVITWLSQVQPVVTLSSTEA